MKKKYSGIDEPFLMVWAGILLGIVLGMLLLLSGCATNDHYMNREDLQWEPVDPKWDHFPSKDKMPVVTDEDTMAVYRRWGRSW